MVAKEVSPAGSVVRWTPATGGHRPPDSPKTTKGSALGTPDPEFASRLFLRYELGSLLPRACASVGKISKKVLRPHPP